MGGGIFKECFDTDKQKKQRSHVDWCEEVSGHFLVVKLAADANLSTTPVGICSNLQHVEKKRFS
jgi:hypothetical protein